MNKNDDLINEKVQEEVDTYLRENPDLIKNYVLQCVEEQVEGIMAGININYIETVYDKIEQKVEGEMPEFGKDDLQGMIDRSVGEGMLRFVYRAATEYGLFEEIYGKEFGFASLDVNPLESKFQSALFGFVLGAAYQNQRSTSSDN